VKERFEGNLATITTKIGPGVERGLCPYASVYSKVQAGSKVDTQPNVNRGKEEEGKEACCLAQAGLSSYL
jgi:hypothetical protein